MVYDATLRSALAKTLVQTGFTSLGSLYEGEVRDNYVRGDRRLIVATDRLSAFDRVVTTLPFKGQVLNQLSSWWFRETERFAPNHLIATPDPSIAEVEECSPLAVEI